MIRALSSVASTPFGGAAMPSGRNPRGKFVVPKRTTAALLAVIFWPGLFFPGSALAQELAPRAYWPTPNGTNVLVLSYQNNSGDIVTDPSLPLTGVDSDIHFLQASYQRTFSLAGRTASLQVSLPYSRGNTEGFVDGQFRSRETAGVGDTRIRLSYNLRGAPSMDREGFKELRQAPRTIVGASIMLQVPSGAYDADRLINIGTNRWAIKPAIGVIWPLRPTWLLEFELGAWFMGDNENFLGSVREQDPIYSTEIHLVKRIKPGFWVSLDANFYTGGETRVGNAAKANLQRNSRIGATAVFPFKGRHALRTSFSTGVVTESGGDFDTFMLAYLIAW